MKKRMLCFSSVIIVGAFLMGCMFESKLDITENPNSHMEIDYSMYDFAGIQWSRETECDKETLCFLPNGEFRYSCACGNPVNDADMVESYSYDDATQKFTLNCYEEIEGMITEIELVSCEDERIELDFGGDIRIFYDEGS